MTLQVPKARQHLWLITKLHDTPSQMQGLPATASQSCTILRIKRKRNEEPLDALGETLVNSDDMNHNLFIIVVESRVRRKKSRGGVGVFQYAQTVENDAWDDVQRQKDIQVA